MNQPPTYLLRPMRYEDITQVVEIDRKSFPIPWTPSVYRYEISQNTSSEMVVLSRPGPGTLPTQRGGLLSGLLDRLRGRTDLENYSLVVGYGGFWFNHLQAHISTIAVRPDYRGHSLGETLLAGMIRRAINLGAQVVSLEVRVSNTRAIALYRKYEFVRVGLKYNYYRDNSEDAYDMRIAPLDEAYRERFEARWAVLQAHVGFVDQFSTAHRMGRLFRQASPSSVQR